MANVAGNVELTWVDPVLPAGPARVEVLVDGVVVGDVDIRLCHQACRLGIVEHVRVDSAARRRRLATQALEAVVAAYPDYEWSTSPLADTAEARGFWAAIAWPGTLSRAHPCRHMRRADQHIP